MNPNTTLLSQLLHAVQAQNNNQLGSTPTHLSVGAITQYFGGININATEQNSCTLYQILTQLAWLVQEDTLREENNGAV